MCVEVENVSALLREMIAQLTGDAAGRRTRLAAAGVALAAARERLKAPGAQRLALLADVKAPLQALQHVNEVRTPAHLRDFSCYSLALSDRYPSL